MLSFLILRTVFDKKYIFHSGVLEHREPFSKIFMIAGLIVTLIGYIFFYLNYSRLGSITDIFFSLENRTDRNAALTEQRGNLPFTHFLFVGIMLIYSSRLLAKKRIGKALMFTFIFLGPLLLFYLVDGERTALLKYIVGIFFVTIFFHFREPIFAKKRHLILFTLGFMIMGFLGNFRGPIGLSLIEGNIDPIVKRIERKQKKGALAIFIPNEFPAVNFTMNRVIYNHTEEGSAYLNGESYIHAIPYLFPRTVYDGFGSTKQMTIADNLGEEIRLEVGRIRKMGFGMSPLGESFANFGIFGPIFFSLLVFFWIRLLYFAIYSNNSVFVFWGALQTPTLFMLNRSAFSSIFSGIVWTSAIFVIGYLIAAFVYFILPKVRSN
tara:strand:- start:1449 stop:2585 length:1137 start_codon:yes stop_codon:yes gene_type:complete